MATKDEFDADEQSARQEAQTLWEADGRPDGGAERYLEQAREIIAIKQSNGATLRPVEETLEEPAESPLAVENQADMPGLTDLENAERAPSWAAARELADSKPLSVDKDSEER